MSQDTPVSLPQRDILNQTQVNTVLQVISMSVSALVHAKSLHDEKELSPEVACAAECTLFKAFDRLDSILADDSRWDIKTLHAIERNLEQLLAARLANEQQVNLPHRKFRPALMRMGEGWVAVYGDPAFLDKALVGYGETPEAAIRCFDMLFEGQVHPDLLNWLTQQKQNEPNKVDGSGDNRTEAPEERGPIDSGDSDGSGPNSPVG